MAELVALTTTDNPYNPFTQFRQWQAFDHYKGYYTMEYIARIANTNPFFSDEVNDKIWEDAINEIVYYNLTGNYKKVRESDYDTKSVETNGQAS